MIGRLPFDGDKPVDIFRQIASKKPVWIPEDLDPPSADMLRWLLQKDPVERVQANTKGYRVMREHPFFLGFDFDGLINRSIKPPCVPQEEQYSEDINTMKDDHALHGGSPERSPSSRNSPFSSDEVDGWDADF